MIKKKLVYQDFDTHYRSSSLLSKPGALHYRSPCKAGAALALQAHPDLNIFDKLGFDVLKLNLGYEKGYEIL